MLTYRENLELTKVGMSSTLGNRKTCLHFKLHLLPVCLDITPLQNDSIPIPKQNETATRTGSGSRLMWLMSTWML